MSNEKIKAPRATAQRDVKATILSADWCNSMQGKLGSIIKGASKKTSRSAAAATLAGFWLAPDWPSLEMLQAGVRAADFPGTPLTRMEAAWRAIRGEAVACPPVHVAPQARVQSAPDGKAAAVSALLALVEDAIGLMTEFHRHAVPDDIADMDVIFPAAAFRKFVDGQADLMFRLDQASKGMTPARPTDSERLDRLADMGGFVRGTADGVLSYRIMMHNTWHPTLRVAIDDAVAKTTKPNLTPTEE